jgi:hypothetical protein
METFAHRDRLRRSRLTWRQTLISQANLSPTAVPPRSWTKPGPTASVKQWPLRETRDPDESLGTPARPAARAFWQDVPIPKSRDVSLLRPPTLPRGQRFETLADAAKIDQANIDRLLNSRPDLAAEIERCDEEGEGAALPISARAACRYRRYFTAELLRVAREIEGPHQIATIFLRRFPPGELGAANLELAHEALRKTVQRSGFQGSVLIGGTEIAWLNHHSRWILHVHLLAIRVRKADWDRLRKSLPDATPATALKFQALKDFAKQLSYCQKLNSGHKPGKRGPDGGADTYRLPTERLIEWAEWMAKRSFEDFAFLFGARRRAGRIVVES